MYRTLSPIGAAALFLKGISRPIQRSRAREPLTILRLWATGLTLIATASEMTCLPWGGDDWGRHENQGESRAGQGNRWPFDALGLLIWFVFFSLFSSFLFQLVCPGPHRFTGPYKKLQGAQVCIWPWPYPFFGFFPRRLFNCVQATLLGCVCWSVCLLFCQSVTCSCQTYKLVYPKTVYN